ncbi:hypothetical protein [Allorhodopirellula heiligendammensis]|uniref:Uncharacterized protein n=1 Tax=Allorhodopirellula heiligendammensis TaxID=2714739 RepID=A0A5C6BBW0_9BACT|nr:hypothetical protein [Allorhodopirellula heiligendammensis]TWU09735.1 hypothetical protein Poly21_55400 [Allorhodopirellula heiligendammensis]
MSAEAEAEVEVEVEVEVELGLDVVPTIDGTEIMNTRDVKAIVVVTVPPDASIREPTHQFRF